MKSVCRRHSFPQALYIIFIPPFCPLHSHSLSVSKYPPYFSVYPSLFAAQIHRNMYFLNSSLTI